MCSIPMHPGRSWLLLFTFLGVGECLSQQPLTTWYRIAFGSCGNQHQPMPILDRVIAHDPDLFIYLGDNIYSDTYEADTLRKNYAALAAKPEFQRLKAHCPLVATWDDHDYGLNDGGRHYLLKEPSRDIFLGFWNEPTASERRTHAGIYHSQFMGPDGSVQVILLDLRTFRDGLLPNDSLGGHKNDYRPHPTCDSTLLGAEQWTWLEARLRAPARVRIIASSTQFGHEYNGYESWTNFPCEQQRMIGLLNTTGAVRNSVFISGDVHWGEISLRTEGLAAPLYDVTSSGLTEEWSSVEPNRHRAGKVVRQNNFGLIDIMLQADSTVLHLRLVDVKGIDQVQERIAFPATVAPPTR